MLLTKTVIVKWYYRTKEWYESKGYVFTKWYDEFEVKVEDLSIGSHVFVDVMCDNLNCKNPHLKSMRWKDYLRYVKEDGKIYCNPCASKLYGNENYRKARLKNSESFGYWIIKNLPLKEATQILARWDYESNSCDPRDISFSSQGENKKGYYLKCPRRIHKSELKDISSFTTGEGSIDCVSCNSFAQWGYDNVDDKFLEKYWDYSKNIDKSGNPIDPWKISKCCDNKIWIFCQEKEYHGSYPIACANFTKQDQRCSYCHGLKVHKYDSLGWLHPQVFDIWSDKNKKSPYEYAPFSMIKVWWKCPDGKHEDYKREIASSNQREFRCAECSRERDESILQEKTRLYLETLGYEVLHEQHCTLVPKNIIEPPKGENFKRTKKSLKYDNEIIINDKHLFIEVMGQQHEKVDRYYHERPTKKYGTTPEQEFKYQVQKDRYKEQYVYNQGENYYYLAIWYYDFDKEDTYKKLIDNKIRDILHKINIKAS